MKHGALIVFASGEGSNFRALYKHFPDALRLVATDRSESGAAVACKEWGVPLVCCPKEQGESRERHEERMLGELRLQFSASDGGRVQSPTNGFEGFGVGGPKQSCLVVLAGYMRVLSGHFLQSLDELLPGHRIINLHPAHLDQYKGAQGWGAAVKSKCPRWGLSVHNVTPQLDSGELLWSEDFSVFPYEAESELRERIKKQENDFLVKCVSKLLSDEVQR